MISNFGNSFNLDRQLFRQEIRAAVAHCNGLFRAGILTRIEAERLKNGLWTILKRADFDRHFFDSELDADVFAFVESRLFQLVNHHADAVKIGRDRPTQRRIALRLRLRDQLGEISATIENLIETLHRQPENAIFQKLAENLFRDAARFAEILPRINRMPQSNFAARDEMTAELDFEMIAHELNFQFFGQNSADSAGDADFCIEFAAAAALGAAHLAGFAKESLRRSDLNLDKQRAFEVVCAKVNRSFANHAALLALLADSAWDSSRIFENAADFNELCAAVFDVCDTLKTCLEIVLTNSKN